MMLRRTHLLSKVAVTLSLTAGVLVSGTGPAVSAENRDTRAREKQDRIDLGLRSDDLHIARLHAQPDRHDGRYGLLLTAEEARELDIRHAVTHEVMPRAIQYLAKHPEIRPGGFYIDVHTGDLTLAVTGRAAEALRVLQSFTARKDRVATVLVRYDTAQLRTTRHAIMLARNSDPRFVVHSAGINPIRNTVVAYASGDLTAAASVLRARHGDFVDVRYGQAAVSKAGIGPRTGIGTLNAPPLRGGQKIEPLPGTGADFCTQGFIARDTSVSPYAYYSLSAGHCGAAGTAWYHPDAPPETPSYAVGRITRQALSATSGVALADTMAMRISTNAQSNDVAVFANVEGIGFVDNINITARQGSGQGAVNEWTCQSGLVVHYECGQIIDNDLEVCYDFRGYYPNRTICFESLRRVAMHCYSGDSGGPFFTPMTPARTATAMGTVVGGTPDRDKNPNSFCDFSHIWEVVRSVSPMELVMTTF